MRHRVVALGLLAAIAGCAQLPSANPDAASIQGATPAPEATAVVPAPGTTPARTDTQAALARGLAAGPAQPAATATPPADLWQRIRGGFRMTNLQGPLVQEWEQWYSTRPDYVARMSERSGRFLYHVIEEVERRGMPAEIALLPMIESAYNPKAYSRSHASGMWQFIPSTGKTYGLSQNFWYDGRRDPIAATSAALDYLEKLHGMFGSWELALAAYNWGEGAVGRAIARNQARGLATDYESLTLPPETRAYVPKLQAVKNIIANPQAYGLRLAEIPNRPYFATVTTDRHIDVKLAARFAELPLEEFRFLNPAHNKPVIKAQANESILLPIEKVDVFRKNLQTHDKPLVSWQAYTVKRSDRAESLAATHGMSVTQLKEVNGIPQPKKIVAGQTIMVPIKGDAEPYLPDLPAPKLIPVRVVVKAKPGPHTRQVSAKGPRHAPAKAQRTGTVKKPAAGAQGKRVKTVAQPPRKVLVADTGKSVR